MEMDIVTWLNAAPWWHVVLIFGSIGLLISLAASR